MLRAFQRVIILFVFAFAGLMLSPTTASACGYFDGYDDCGKPAGWDLKYPNKDYKPVERSQDTALGRHGGIDWGRTFQSDNGCGWLCGEGTRQREFNQAPKPNLNTDMCPDGHPRYFGVC